MIDSFHVPWCPGGNPNRLAHPVKNVPRLVATRDKSSIIAMRSTSKAGNKQVKFVNLNWCYDGTPQEPRRSPSASRDDHKDIAIVNVLFNAFRGFVTAEYSKMYSGYTQKSLNFPKHLKASIFVSF